MSLSFTATVENNTIKLPPRVQLPDGTEVRVEPQTTPGHSGGEPQKFITRTRDFGFKPGIAAAKWLDEVLQGGVSVGLPWQSSVGSVRITTNPRIMGSTSEDRKIC